MTTDEMWAFLDENGGKQLRMFFADGSTIDCKFDGYCYDYDDAGNEFVEFTFKDLERYTYFDPAPLEDIEKIETIAAIKSRIKRDKKNAGE